MYLNFHLIPSTSLCTELRSKKCPRCFPEICPTQKASVRVQTSTDLLVCKPLQTVTDYMETRLYNLDTVIYIFSYFGYMFCN